MQFDTGFIRLCTFAVILGISGIAVAQTGTSQAQTQTTDRLESRFSGYVSTAVRRNFDAASKAMNRTLFGLSFAANEQLSIDVDSGHDVLLTKFDANQQRDVWGLRDTDITATLAKVGKIGAGQLSIYTTGTLPTSKGSRKATLRFSIAPGITWSAKFGRTTLNIDSSVNYSNYELETADAAGTDVNSPIGWLNELKVGYLISDTLSFGISGVSYNYQTFRGKDKGLLALGGGLSYKWTETWSSSVSYLWKDSIVTNNSVFDDDTSVLSIGLSASL